MNNKIHKYIDFSRTKNKFKIDFNNQNKKTLSIFFTRKS
ncbi:hypothetical protein RIEPE_0535 [Candidatus Riesia pediculicola USDA]|uniref:Uncharacterized protein n=1 Tax=Riesia pediculicola (strain USDA) TaxID=515618 RepID=D4G8V9_RIEPU|nr:hypothetical protein RIEPE_0535 [Candidatus Riesia pediculicola USDA]